MVVLDTDHMSVLEWTDSPPAVRLEERLGHLHSEDIATTILSFEEQTRGWLTVLAKARKLTDQVQVYHRLRQQLEIYCGLKILAFTEPAAAEFQRLRKVLPRVGVMDLKIAAVALVHEATVLTRNVHDFRQVPGLSVEDWTK
jgi:tRNA(fMet)-specific endonuclease VapC